MAEQHCDPDMTMFVFILFQAEKRRSRAKEGKDDQNTEWILSCV